MNGWNSDELASVTYLCDKIYSLNYELKSCAKGSYTGCRTYEELGEYIQRLGEQLAEAGEDIINCAEYIERDEETNEEY